MQRMNRNINMELNFLRITICKNMPGGHVPPAMVECDLRARLRSKSPMYASSGVDT